MDLREYYRKIREVEQGLSEEVVVIARGVCSEVSRAAAARLIAEGKVRLATACEAEAFRTRVAERWLDTTGRGRESDR